MAEKLLEKPVCQACRADVRPHALFCYNCGSSVINAQEGNAGKNGMSRFRLRDDASQGENNNFAAGHGGRADLPIEKPAEDPFTLPVQEKSKIQGGNLAADRKAGPKNPASVRKKNRAAANKKIEVIWEPPDDSSNILFIVASVFLLLVALGILVAMLYIR